MKISELTGRALDAAVHVALGHELPMYAEPCIPRYSTYWGDGGPIIEEKRILVGHDGKSPYACANPSDFEWYGAPGVIIMDGPTTLIAAMRFIVAQKFGNVDVQITDRPHPAEVRILLPE